MFKKLTLALALLCAHNASYSAPTMRAAVADTREEELRGSLETTTLACTIASILAPFFCVVGEPLVGTGCCCMAATCACCAYQTMNELHPLEKARQAKENRKAQEEHEEREREAKKWAQRRAPRTGYMYKQ